MRAYSTMLPRLQAEEHLAQLRIATAAGSVAIPERDYRSLVRELETRVDGVRRRATKATVADLQSIGIAVRHV